MSVSTSRTVTSAATLILILLLSSLIGAFQPEIEVEEDDTSSLFSEDVILTLAQQESINRVTGRVSDLMGDSLSGACGVTGSEL